MENLDDFDSVNTVEAAEVESIEINEPINDSLCDEMILGNTMDSLKTNLDSVNVLCERPKETTLENEINFDVSAETHFENSEDSKSCQIIDEKPNIKQTIEVINASDIVPNKVVQFSALPKIERSGNTVIGSCGDSKISSNRIVKKIINLADAFTDSSRSSSSELQSTAAPFESSSSSQENHVNAFDFESAIESEKSWKEAAESLSGATNDLKMEVDPLESAKPVLSTDVPSENISHGREIPVITIDDNTQPSTSEAETAASNNIDNSFLTPGFIQPPSLNQTQANDTQSEVKIEPTEQQAVPQPIPIPVIPPAPRKRGRPRKQVLPNPSPLMESWGSNAQEFPTVEVKQERKRSVRGERRQTKRKKFEDGEGQDGDENVTRRRRSYQTTPKKKRRSTYVPKKRVPPVKKKHSEIENIQNFEEETRMSASEGPGGFSSRSGAAGDESQGSSATDGPGRSNINKKGRMEVGTDGCKPVTVQQIVEYFWPPPSSLPHGEKPEGLMIQEQITEYLGVKSFKRKYPSIKRRPVDMEERNYLQENGFVSENMCDLGLTAVFAADIIEIMYNDFPHKFEEYRKYTREKKAKEQRALREKQAAERADMDPKKEAIESTISWNSEFNKTRRFKIVHRDPKQSIFCDGRPCPVSTRVVILHAPCNAALCVESDYKSMSLFSHEYEISGHSRIDHLKNYLSPNIWMILAGSI